MPDRFAPAGPLALVLLAVTEGRYADALEQLERFVAFADGDEQARARELGVRLATRIAVDGPPELRARAELVAGTRG